MHKTWARYKSTSYTCRIGWFLFLFYIGGFTFYLYVRLSKTLDLGEFTFYGGLLDSWVVCQHGGSLLC